jgi:hypothetical protein
MPVMASDSKKMAEVKVFKPKDCLVLTKGIITPLILQQLTLAIKHYQKHAEKNSDVIISYVADCMLEPCLITWYQGANLVLEKNWAHKIRQQILSMVQGDRHFIDWKIKMENFNALLQISAPTYVLGSDTLKNQLEANLHPDLAKSIDNESVFSTTLAAWLTELKEHDECLREEKDQMQRIIDADRIACAGHKEHRTLLSCISDPPAAPDRSSSSKMECKYLPKLTEAEKLLLNEHNGCACCRIFYAKHRSNNCPMKATGSWPNPNTYQTLTASMAHAAAPCITTTAAAIITMHQDPHNDDTSDSYIILLEFLYDFLHNPQYTLVYAPK